MAFDIWARAQLKWRGVVVYALLQGIARFVATYIRMESHDPRLQLYAAVTQLATSVYCLIQLWRLLTVDQEGDNGWPPLWS